ncbi:CsbD family protein [Xanthobacter sp. V2C-8]|uniref:CsbD family protein n=1 Tax=Xanthobacter albus TaxID=3119929 RepID=UPI00372A8EFE
MNWDRIGGNWKQLSGQVKAQWGKLTDDDLTQIAGQREALEGKIQERYGLTKDEVKRQVDKFGGSLN